MFDNNTLSHGKKSTPAIQVTLHNLYKGELQVYSVQLQICSVQLSFVCYTSENKEYYRKNLKKSLQHKVYMLRHL